MQSRNEAVEELEFSNHLHTKVPYYDAKIFMVDDKNNIFP
jgi:hypothetical protein